ncbi:MAG: CPBP family intramembrane glutamic endopeptidase [Bacillota bacterium]
MALVFVTSAGLGGAAAELAGLSRRDAQLASAWLLQGTVGVVGYAGWRRLARGDPARGDPEGGGKGAPPPGTAAAWRWVRAGLAGVPFGVVLVGAQAAVNALVGAGAQAAGWGEVVRRLGVEEQQSLNALVLQAEGIRFFSLVVLLVLLAPVSEELFFRGYLYGLLRGPGGMKPFPGAAVSALAFAGLHAYVVHLPALWVVGVLLALWYERRRRLAAAIGAHVGANALTLALLLVGRIPAAS